ncbi:T9SS type A sorting domain-containing protein [Rhodocytophaga rosea]|uniref:T9SS type A sorting domain-containing protein n=1 Tax=Rhodocytophaga rosea TaxID=2704465 RepID=A0A6C0GKQ4_9BACT|nr:T9SS type A sorting domain-containing protein [Rhodocytophaga rosea]QHT68585.1 T9SS type A sorting domain-containing protein [Rhodocytophaga rosea]
MLRYLLLLLLSASYVLSASAQSGCTDPLASNYDPAAKVNNGSCSYPTTNTTLNNPKDLSTTLNESSGLAYTDGKLWSFNDSGNSATLYRISESNGSILQTITVTNATNVDWEDITADANYLYIGDFGNNINGNRTDLKIYRISKAALGNAATTSVMADVINFTYSDQDQTNLPPTGNNNTEFDCEAFFIKDNQFHLFSKDWVGANGYSTKHYTLPAIPGTYIAQKQAEFPVNGAITGADISTTNLNEVVLIGYDINNGSLFMWLLFDYTGNIFFSGNKRQIGLSNVASYGQIEGVTYTGDLTGYISSERFERTVIIFGFPFQIVVPARLYSFSTAGWIPLPVELISFTATHTNSSIQLSWQTASETDNDYFTVERSENGIDFQEIGQQKGEGNSKSIQNYQFTDTEPLYGINYYRLKQTDLDGTYTYSGIRSIEVKSGRSKIDVNPVPVRQGEMITIHLNGASVSSGKLILRSMDGKIHLEQVVSFTKNIPFQLQTGQIKPGMYILQIDNTTQLYTSKVVIY